MKQIAVHACLLLLGLCTPACRKSAIDLPPVDASGFQPEVRAAVEKAARAAKDGAPESAGEYCMTLHAHQLLDPARECYRRLRAAQPADPRWAYLLATLTRSAADWKQAVALNAGSLPAQLHLADALLETGAAPAEAEAAYRAALRLDPNQPLAHYGLGRAATAQRDAAAAVEHLQHAVALHPQFGPAHYALGQAYARLGDDASAKRHLALASDGRPPLVDPMLEAVARRQAGGYNMVSEGVQLAAAGRLEEAAAKFEAAAAAKPDDVAAHQNLVVVYGRLNRIADAERHYREATARNPNAAEAHFNYGVLMARTGRDAEARQAFEKALAAEPRNAEAHVNLGVLDEAANKADAAQGHFRSALETEPAHPGANFRLGRALLAARNAAGALRHLEAAARSDDPALQAQALYGSAVAHRMLGQRDKAQAAAQSAIAKAGAAAQPDLAAAIRREFGL